MSRIGKLGLKTPNFLNKNIEKLATLFPHCVIENTEGENIDFGLLLQMLINNIEEVHRERYCLENYSNNSTQKRRLK